VTPICDAAGSCLIGVGVAPRIVTVQSAVVDGVTFPFVAMGGIVAGLDALITGQVKGGLLGPNGLTGPIGIGAITAGQVSQGPPAYIFLVALLSVALGFTNLLPLLALDGGRIVVVVIEWLRRRPFDRNSELNLQRWGLVALLALAAIISFLDIQRIATGQFTGVH
jgi:regulator of sigma E protease